jgi:hypothetical protein
VIADVQNWSAIAIGNNGVWSTYDPVGTATYTLTLHKVDSVWRVSTLDISDFS